MSWATDWILIYNLGVDGDDTSGLLKRFDSECKVRLLKWQKESRKIIFAIGLNDSCYRGSKNNAATPLNLFKDNLLHLIKNARKITSEIIFVGITKGSDKETMPLKASMSGKCYDKENVKIYNDAIKKVCEREKILFVDIINKINDEDFYDGLHPNAAGHQKIFEIVKDFLIKNKIVG